MTTGRRSSRSVHSVNVRRRSYVALVNAHDSNTSNARETLVTPSKGKRIRLLRVRVIQEQADGRHLAGSLRPLINYFRYSCLYSRLTSITFLPLPKSSRLTPILMRSPLHRAGC